MPIGIGIGLTPSMGGFARTGAQALLGTEPNGFAVDWTDNSSVLRRNGVAVAKGTANSQLVLTGTLTSGPNGAHFDASNNAYLDMSGFSDLATYRLTCTLFAEASVDALTGVIKTSISFSDTVTGNLACLRHTSATNVPVANVISSTVTQASPVIAGAAPSAAVYYKMGLGALVNDFDSAWATLGGTHDNSGLMPVNPVRCFFGVGFGANLPLLGNIKRAMILPRKMSLAELQAKTT